MDISEEQTTRYIKELQTLRNDRLHAVLSDGVTLEYLIADIMNALEVLFVIHRSKMEQDPTGE